MGLFDKLFGEKIPKYKKYRIEITETLLAQTITEDNVKLIKPIIVEFMTKLDFDVPDFLIEVATKGAMNEVIGEKLKTFLSDEYVNTIFLPIAQKSLLTTDEKELKQLLNNIKNKKIYEEI